MEMLERTFSYEDCTFKPVGTIPKRMKYSEECKYLKADNELELSAYNYNYNYTGFYKRCLSEGCNDSADIFECIENGKKYIPCSNELFEWTGPYEELVRSPRFFIFNDAEYEENDDTKESWLMLLQEFPTKTDFIESIKENYEIGKEDEYFVYKDFENDLPPLKEILKEFNKNKEYGGCINGYEQISLNGYSYIKITDSNLFDHIPIDQKEYSKKIRGSIPIVDEYKCYADSFKNNEEVM